MFGSEKCREDFSCYGVIAEILFTVAWILGLCTNSKMAAVISGFPKAFIWSLEFQIFMNSSLPYLISK